jgi:integrase
MGMKKLVDTHHLIKREAVWYYHRRVPKLVQTIIGRQLLHFSLGTPHKKIAIRKRELLDVEWRKKFDEAEAAQRPSARQGVETPAAHKRVLTEAEAHQRVQAFVEKEDERRRKGELTAAPLDEDERREWEKELELDVAIAQGRTTYNFDEFISREWERIFPRTELAVDEQTFPAAAVFDLVKRAATEIAERALARERDDHRHSHFDRLFDPKVPLAVSVRDLAEQLMTLRSEEAEAHKMAKKTLVKQRTNLELVREILGDETLVRDLNWDACRRFCSVLAQVPPNRTKRYPGQPLDETITRAKEEGSDALSAVTQQQYLATLKELLALAVKKDLIRVNYAEDLRPLKADDLAPEEKRKPFEIDQLKAFFRSTFYRACADAGDIPYRQADEDWRYWFPLLSLFTGMRPKEVFQLHLEDLKESAQGTWYLHITATSEDDDAAAPERKKTIKTLTSKRQIPVHPELARLGFLKFVDDQRTASDDPLLFRGLPRDIYGDPAAYPLKRFRETYLKAIELKPRQSPYSFRHTWRDAARRINASPDFLKAFGGWSDGKTTADNYGSKDQPDLHAKDMAKIAFEGLDLSYLYPK